MSERITRNWWLVPAIGLAGLHMFVASELGYPSSLRSPSVFIGALGLATLAGVTVRNRAPKLAGLLLLAGVWAPVLTAFKDPGTEYGGPVGVIAAVLTAVGAIQNMTRRPITAEPRPA